MEFIINGVKLLYYTDLKKEDNMIYDKNELITKILQKFD